MCCGLWPEAGVHGWPNVHTGFLDVVKPKTAKDVALCATFATHFLVAAKALLILGA